VLKTDDWGNRKLAYTIKKRSNAFYTFLLYTGNAASSKRWSATSRSPRNSPPPDHRAHRGVEAEGRGGRTPAGEAPADSGTPAPETPQTPAAPAEA